MVNFPLVHLSELCEKLCGLCVKHFSYNPEEMNLLLEAQGCEEGKTQPQGSTQSEIRPIVVESPQNDEGGRGLATDSGDQL